MEKDGISTFAELWRVHLQGRPGAPTERTLQQWNSIGGKFINLAAGGSLYMLVYLTGIQYLWPTEKLVGDVSHAIAIMLRDPSLSGEPPLPLFQSSNLFLLLQRHQISSSPTSSLPLDTFDQRSRLLWWICIPQSIYNTKDYLLLSTALILPKLINCLALSDKSMFTH